MELFDKDAFNNLIDGDKKLFAELLELYAVDYPKILTDLKKAIETADARQVEILAHRLRGMVRNFFAPTLADQAEVIEEGGRANDLSGIGERLDSLSAGLRALEDELAAHLRSLS